jgi:Zn-dependent protease
MTVWLTRMHVAMLGLGAALRRYWKRIAVGAGCGWLVSSVLGVSAHRALIFVALIGLVAFSVLVHEGGHALAARRCGWRIRGVAFHPLGGVGFRIEVGENPAEVWKVALAGLAASGMAALGFFALSPLGPIFYCGFVLNAVLMFVNLWPCGAADGGHVLRGLRIARNSPELDARLGS